MSIWAEIITIEDERQWRAALEAQGIKTGVIRDGEPDFDDLDAPIVYQGSHVLPDEAHVRGGSVGLALIPAHVRFWRDNPDANGEDEPDDGAPEPFLRLDVEGEDGTVVLTRRQATRLRDALNDWLGRLDA